MFASNTTKLPRYQLNVAVQDHNLENMLSKSRRRFRRRCLILFVLSLTGFLIFVTLSSHSHFCQSIISSTTGKGHFRIFDRFGSISWYASNSESDHPPGIMNDVKYKGTKKLPSALIIGAKKAGTRALLEFIRVHPNVRAAGSEIHYFDKNFSEGLDWYRDMMPTSIKSQITIEKTPSYLVTPEAPKRVYDMNPSMKLIVVLKDPVDRAVSDFTQSFMKHRRRHSFEDSVFMEANHTLIVNSSKPNIKTGLYSKHLKMWLEYFPLRQFCFINGETMVTQPAVEMKKLQDFLEIKQVINEEHFYFNSSKGFPCLKKREASGTPHCLGIKKGRPHPVIPTRASSMLYDFYRPSNTELYKMTGINFNWEKNEPVLYKENR
uniref:heparan sulfate glucosamine 3-O-sulfotransferase 6-like n=1 Tax=Styela clava TaxID=7725 RepID=UPI00193A4305|nr:heparan sulfate glucosamine 3-O-sulfotransferase 6-like [Styela clava]